MTDLLASFVAEGRDLTRQLAKSLAALERAPDTGGVEEVFRAVHTLKGSSGLFDLPALTTLAHAAEDLLEAHRGAGRPPGQGAIGRLLEATDLIAGWIDTLELTRALPADAAAAAQALARQLHAATPGAAGHSAGELTPERLEVLPGLGPLVAAAHERLTALGTAPVTVLHYRPDAQSFFRGDDPVLLWKRVPELIDWRLMTQAPWAPPEGFDPYLCNLDFAGISAAGQDEVAHLFRYVSEEARMIAMPADTLAALAAAACAAAPVPNAGDPAGAAAVLSEQTRVLAAADPADAGFGGTVAAIAGLARNLAAAVPGIAEALAGIDAAATEARANRDPEVLGSALGAACRALAARPCPAPDSAAEPRGQDADPADPAGARLRNGAATEKPAAFVRVEAQRLDRLMNLIGELVVAKNALPFLARRADQEFGTPVLARAIDAQHAVVDRLAHEMQDAMLQLRLMPVSVVFDRFPRMVRELARRLGKDVRLAVEGGETEIDKSIVEHLGEPLVHILRNALDHGIEPPEERVAFGKPARACLRLSARGEAGQIVIEVADDGRGIDPARLRATALARRLIDETEADRLDDQEALQLIFRAGLSTTEEVSELSGRGVGMDAVLTEMRRAGGRVEVASEPGKGTSLRLSLPLSMAISRVVIVRVGEAIYGIPMDAIFEICRVPRAEIRRACGRETAVLRGRVVPLVWLGRLFGDAGTSAAPHDQEVVVVIASGNDLFGFVVDDLHGRMETIVKPMEGVIAGLAGFAGTALMGDGRVLLVLNPEELARADAA